jgi:hypothetical protein
MPGVSKHASAVTRIQSLKRELWGRVGCAARLFSSIVILQPKGAVATIKPTNMYVFALMEFTGKQIRLKCDSIVGSS